MSFNISDKVICVDDHAPKDGWVGSPVEQGVIYVVRDVWLTTYAPHRAIIQLVGFPEIKNKFGRRIGYRVARFRKLSEVQAENRAIHEQFKNLKL